MTTNKPMPWPLNCISTVADATLLFVQASIFVIAIYGVAMSLLLTNFNYAPLEDVIVKVGLRETTHVDDQDTALNPMLYHQLIKRKAYRQNGLTIA